MKRKNEPDTRTEVGSLADAAAGDVNLRALQRAVDVTRDAEVGLSDIQLARVGQRLLTTRSPVPPAPFLLLGLRAGTLALVLLVGGVVGAAATLVSQRISEPRGASARPAADVVVLPGTRQLVGVRRAAPAVVAPAPPVLPVLPVLPEPEAEAPAGVETPSAASEPVRRPRPARRAVAGPTPVPAYAKPEPSAVTIEARALTGALATLRQAGDARQALRQLDDYLVRFPRGTFSDEARMARAEALAASGDRVAAERALRDLAARRPDLGSKLEKLIRDL